MENFASIREIEPPKMSGPYTFEKKMCIFEKFDWTKKVRKKRRKFFFIFIQKSKFHFSGGPCKIPEFVQTLKKFFFFVFKKPNFSRSFKLSKLLANFANIFSQLYKVALKLISLSSGPLFTVFSHKKDPIQIVKIQALSAKKLFVR